jgi:ATP-binding cassette, subfamily C, bacterial CydC
MSVLGRLLGLTGATRGRVALSVLLGSATLLCGVGLLAMSGYLISRAAEHPPVLALMTAIVGVRFFGLARPAARYLDRLTSHDLALRDLARVRVETYERIEPLAPAALDDREGDLLSRLVADVDALQNLHLRGIGPPLVALCSSTVAVGVAAAFLPLAGVVLAAGLATGGLLVPFTSTLLARRGGQREAQLRGELSAELVELLRGAPELVAYGREEERIRRIEAADRALVRLARRGALADGAGEGLGLAVTGATVAAVLAVSVSAHAAGRLEGVLIALLGLLALASFEAVAPLGQAARELVETLAAGRRLLEVLDRESPVRDHADPAEVPDGPVAVALEHVRAGYAAGAEPVLDDFSLRLEPGGRVALVGPSGAGKTTVTNLLLRFVDPQAGRVTLAGRDLRDYRQEEVRRTIAVAAQDAYLFSASIRDNLRIARPEAGDAELEAALRRAGIWPFVSALPDGLDTRVGEDGRELSGGQRQRIALARAFLANARVLVLDEPTAHLDHAAAERLTAEVFAAAGDTAVLLITHRPEGLELVDEVVEVSRRGPSRCRAAAER